MARYCTIALVFIHWVTYLTLLFRHSSVVERIAVND